MTGKNEKATPQRIALVTGVAGSIGAAIAETLIEQGHRVIGVDKQAASTTPFAPEPNQYIKADLSTDDFTTTLTNAGVDLGAVDILINCAGVLDSEKSLQTTMAHWHWVMRINVDAILLLVQATAPGMLERGWGRIVNLGSLAARTGGITAGTGYATSKAAVEGLTRSLAREFAAKGVTANVIAPAYIESEMVSGPLNSRAQADLREGIPVKRFGRPDEIAHLVSALVHDKGAYMTGEILYPSGGLSLG